MVWNILFYCTLVKQLLNSQIRIQSLSIYVQSFVLLTNFLMIDWFFEPIQCFLKELFVDMVVERSHWLRKPLQIFLEKLFISRLTHPSLFLPPLLVGRTALREEPRDVTSGTEQEHECQSWKNSSSVSVWRIFSPSSRLFLIEVPFLCVLKELARRTCHGQYTDAGLGKRRALSAWSFISYLMCKISSMTLVSQRQLPRCRRRRWDRHRFLTVIQ